MINSRVSVVIPAYNESKCIEKTLFTISNYLSKNFADFEIIVVDDGSSDNTFSLVSLASGTIPNLKVLRNPVNRGKGYSVKKGALSAVFDYIIFTDVDLSTPIEELEACIKHFNNGSDIVIGSRALKKSRVIKRQGFLRMNMGKTFNLFIQLILFRGIKDTQCGFKCFKKSVARELFRLQHLRGFCFDVEILYIARKKGYSITEAPVRWINREDSRVAMIRDSVRMFLGLFYVRLNSIRGYYEN